MVLSFWENKECPDDFDSVAYLLVLWFGWELPQGRLAHDGEVLQRGQELRGKYKENDNKGEPHGPAWALNPEEEPIGPVWVTELPQGLVEW